MYGMSAKDRLAMFENKAGGDTKKTSGPTKKKIGKLSVPGPKEAKTTNAVPKKASDLKKVPKKTEKPKAPVEKPEEKKDQELVEKKPEEKVEEHVVNNVEAVGGPQKEDVIEEAKVEAPQKEDVIEEAKVEQPQEPQPEAVAPPEAKDQPKIEVEQTAGQDQKADAVEEVKEEKVEEATKVADKKEGALKEVEKPPQEEATKPVAEKVEEKPKVEEVKQEAKVGGKGKPKPKEQPQPKEQPKAKEKPKPKDQPNKPKEQAPKQPQEAAQVAPEAKTKEAQPKPAEEKKEIQEKTDKSLEQKPALEAKDIPEDSGPQKPKVRPLQARMPLYKSVPEEFYDTLFYFSGMGTVVGSALNEGVFVPQRATRTALETKVIEDVEMERDKERQHETYLIRTARKQAFDLAEELRKLQGLLSGLPSFGEERGELHRIERKPLDSVMHARYHTYEIPHQPQKPRTPPPPPQPSKPPAEEKPWPPPVVEPVKKPVPAVPPPSQEIPVKVETKVGVFKGLADDRPPAERLQINPGPMVTGSTTTTGASTIKPTANQPWQGKYGTHGVTNMKAPEPYNPTGGGKIPSGLKPWELSRARALEVRGYQFVHDQPDSGADHSDTFYRGHASAAGPEVEMTVEVPSLAPFLVSNKSQRLDRQHVMEVARDSGEHHHLRPMTMREYYGLETSSLPYHDV